MLPHKLSAGVIWVKHYRSLLCLFLLPLLALALPRSDDAVAVQNTITPQYIALTFDDGPVPETTQRLLDGLTERGAHATFFLIGEQIDGMEDVVKRMRDEGHQVGNHTYSHARLDRGDAVALADLSKADAQLCEVLGEGEYWVRPPWGFVSDAIKQCVSVPLIYWSVDTEDWRSRNADLIAHTIVETAQNGNIVLLHDIHSASVDAALRAIDTLSAQGYQFVTVEELFSCCGVTPQCGHFYTCPDTEVCW